MIKYYIGTPIVVFFFSKIYERSFMRRLEGENALREGGIFCLMVIEGVNNLRDENFSRFLL